MPTFERLSSAAMSPVLATLDAAKAFIVSPFRRSIWKRTDNYLFSTCSAEDLEGVSRVYDVISAKLRIPFPSAAVCKELLAQIAALPDNPASLAPEELGKALEKYLRATKKMRGVGIPVAICMLAVEKQGAYAPMDDKDAAGLLRLEEISEEQAQSLTGYGVKAFVHAYVYSVLPAWQEQLKERTPDQADAFWGSQASS
ncbi:hypothetical protein [Paraburkholderia sp. MM5384-R2]|uniref:hypothetical protein n=1 Tax=Paraburkholderia sp. MM5384-R2 TaxID=2723097 RepID=UPI00161ABCF5|nr:hypothetical protein [Paraburkholderia sp. MM5384-R2]MBB5503237.1 hypothetical protein [Paraburkholderia sp. MM5384-R2]